MTHLNVKKKKKKEKEVSIIYAAIMYIIIAPVAYSIFCSIIFSSSKILNNGVAGLKGRIIISDILPMIITVCYTIIISILKIKSLKDNQSKRSIFLITVLICLVSMPVTALLSISPRSIDSNAKKMQTYSDDIHFLFKPSENRSVTKTVTDSKIHVLNNVFKVDSSDINTPVYSLKCFDENGEELEFYVSPSLKWEISSSLHNLDKQKKYKCTISYDPDFMVLTDFSIDLSKMTNSLSDSSDSLAEKMESSDILKIYDTSWYNESETEFSITNAGELAGFVYLTINNVDFKGKTIFIENDIDISDYSWTTAGFFCGTLDGNNHSISNMMIISKEAFASFIGLANDAVIKNLKLKNVYLSGKLYTAPFLRSGLRCRIENCSATGTIKCESLAGGICSDIGSSEITNCSSDCTINCSMESGGICA